MILGNACSSNSIPPLPSMMTSRNCSKCHYYGWKILFLKVELLWVQSVNHMVEFRNWTVNWFHCIDGQSMKTPKPFEKMSRIATLQNSEAVKKDWTNRDKKTSINEFSSVITMLLQCWQSLKIPSLSRPSEKSKMRPWRWRPVWSTTTTTVQNTKDQRNLDVVARIAH